MSELNKMNKVTVGAIIEKVIIDELGAVPLDKLENISAHLVELIFDENQGFINLDP